MAELLFKGISRVNEFKDPELLEQSEVQVLDNMVLDKESGKALKRGGMVRFNTNNASVKPYNIWDAIDGSGNNLLFGSFGDGDGDDDGTLKKSTDGTGAWSNVKTGLDDENRLRMAIYSDDFIFTNGVDEPFITDGANTYDLTLDAPDTSNVKSAHTTSSEGNLMANATYKYLVVYVTDSGNRSIASQPFTHYRSTSGNNSTNDVQLKLYFEGLPTSADSRVTGRLIYRTQGNGDTYYFHSRLDNAITTLHDDLADTELLLADYIKYNTDIAWSKYFSIHKERLFLANIRRTPKNYNAPPYSAVTGSAPSGYADGAATAGSGTTGGSLDPSSTYKYRFVYVDDDGFEGDYLEITATTAAGQNAITLTNVPGLENGIAGLRVYRTKDSGDVSYPQFYKLDGLIGVFGTTLLDTIADNNLGDEYAGVNADNFKSTVAVSDLFKISTFPAVNLIQVAPDDGDEITGIVDYDDTLIVFKKNSICSIDTLGSPENWQVKKLYYGIGCDQPDTIIRDGMYIYFVNHNQVYRYPDSLEIPLSMPKYNTFKSITTFHDASFINKENWYVIVGATSSYDRVILIFDTKNKAWYEWTSNTYGNQYTCVTEKKYGVSRGTMLLGLGQESEGWIHKYDETSEQDFSENEYILDEDGNRILLEDGVTYWVSEASQTNIEIQPRLKTKVFTMDNPSTVLRARQLLIDYKKRDGQSLNIRLENPATGEYRSLSDTENSSYSTKYKNIKKVTDAMTGDLRYTNKIEFTLSGAGLREFNGMTFHYRPERRGKRYE